MLIANAFSHFRLRPPRLWGTLADWLLVSYVDLSAKDVGVVLNALSSVGFHHDALLRTLAVSLCHEPLLGQLEPSVLCVVLNALARLHWAGVGLVAQVFPTVICCEDVFELFIFLQTEVHRPSHATQVMKTFSRFSPIAL